MRACREIGTQAAGTHEAHSGRFDDSYDATRCALCVLRTTSHNSCYRAGYPNVPGGAISIPNLLIARLSGAYEKDRKRSTFLGARTQ
jgi:hypothetical protein